MNTQLSFFLFALTGLSASAENVSRLWEDYAAARAAGREPILADFSRAGYHAGDKAIPRVDWKTFDVTDFGAVANDGQSDREAFKAAVAAAEEHGSGIIFFPSGRFRLNDVTDPHNETLVIRSARIVIRGSGRGEGGTELFMERHMDPKDPGKLWTSPYLLEFRGTGKPGKKLAVVGDSLRESFAVEIGCPHPLKAGDWVELYHRDNSEEAVRQAVAPYDPDPNWKLLIEQGVIISEYHSIERVEGGRLIFREPIHAKVVAKEGWQVRKVSFIEEVGVEDIAFVGNWKDAFVHHKDAIHDGGWSALAFKACANSWVRNCRFTDLNRPFHAVDCAALAVEDILLDGNPGHTAISLTNCTHCLVQRVDDKASHWHASGVQGPGSGNVFLRSSYNPDTCFESHASQPRWTLFDNITGGWKYGRWGGALSHQPNHLEGLVFWNYENIGAGEPGAFHFIQPNSEYGRIIMPFVIGFHGNPQAWAEGELRVLESNGKPVHPESLYEAQVELNKSLKDRE